MPSVAASRRHVVLLLLAAAAAGLTGCGAAPLTDADNDAKQAWQSESTAQEFDRLRSRLMTSQTDR